MKMAAKRMVTARTLLSPSTMIYSMIWCETRFYSIL